MPHVITKHEARRGCGYRKPGGFYLVSDGPAGDCGKLPLPCHTCPTCGAGIKPARGFTWVNPAALAFGRPCERNPYPCESCPLGDGSTVTRGGLIWIGQAYYPTPGDFLREAGRMGISRRIAKLPRGFVIGETWVALGHQLGIIAADGTPTPAIFSVFKPARCEYVVADDDPADKLARLERRGFSLVKVIPAGDGALFRHARRLPAKPKRRKPAKPKRKNQ